MCSCQDTNRIRSGGLPTKTCRMPNTYTQKKAPYYSTWHLRYPQVSHFSYVANGSYAGRNRSNC